MSRRLALHGFALVVVLACVGKAYAQQVDQDVADAAAEAGVEPVDLQGALNSLHDAGLDVSARTYLIAEGLIAAPAPACGWPICGPLGARIYCIEEGESTHGAHMYNPTPVRNGEHAQGFLGFLPSTARRWGAVIGDRASEWNAAAAMIRAGAGGQFAGIAWGRC